MRRFVAVDSDNGDAKIIHAENDKEVRRKLVDWMLNEEIVDDKNDAKEIVDQNWDIYPVSEEIK